MLRRTVEEMMCELANYPEKDC